MYKLIDYYEEINGATRKNLLPGRICYAPIPYLLERRITYCELEYFNNLSPGNYSLRTRTDEIKDIDPKELPILTQINIVRGAILPLNPYKFRPVIIINGSIPNIRDHENNNGEIHCVVPLYKLVDTNNLRKYSDDFCIRLQAYKYPSLFYFPPDEAHNIKESVGRFDRILMIKSECLRPVNTKLTDDAYLCLFNWLIYFFTGELTDKVIQLFRDEALKTINDNS